MKVIGTVIVTLLVLVGIAAAVVFSGAYNVAATDKHTAIVNWVLASARVNAVRARVDDNGVPGDLTSEERIAAGAKSYRDMCVGCHGAPGVEQRPFAEHMLPKPPDMKAVAEFWSAAEIHWILDHGFKMTGMPAWGPVVEPETLWDLAAFVQAYPEIDAARFATLSQAAGNAAPGAEPEAEPTSAD